MRSHALSFVFASAALISPAVFAQRPAPPATRPYLEAAKDAARWIDASAIRTAHGVTWPADPNDPKSVGTTLYSGSPGVVLFMLEMHRATGDQAFLDRARLGADQLVASIDSEKETGFYTGLAGIGYTLLETANVTRDAKYRDGARRATERIRSLAHTAGAGIEWNETTDIIGGSAGTGLFLLYAAKELEDPAYRDLAGRAGRRLVELARKDAGGEKWAMTPKFPRLMPNFSHGTAGIAYFLATLSAETGEKGFLDHAIAGAKYLQSVAKTDGDMCLIFHNEPDGKDLYFSGIRLASYPRLAGRYVYEGGTQGETRSHGFFYKPDGDSSGTLGLPVSVPGRPGYKQLFENSAAILFLKNDSLHFREIGELGSEPDKAVDDKCRASCVDWYGNARPLFLRGRVFALLGYEIVEGALGTGRMKEVRRINFAPGRQQITRGE